LCCHKKRTTINGAFAVRYNKTHGKDTISACGFGHFVVRLAKNARKSDLWNLLFCFSRLKIPKNH
jgi:hypothetical protein